jgi:hypothetical protein
MGNTMGEEAVVFFKFITSPKNRTPVYLIDQPEDNISNPRIISKLIESFDNLRDESQLIFVTHNPLLVVNLDVDNVVYLSKINDKINVKSGCLEDDGILDIVADNMDGGREVLKRRLKIYDDVSVLKIDDQLKQQLQAEDLYAAFNYTIGDKYSIVPLTEEQKGNKPLFYFYELIEKIVKDINDIEIEDENTKPISGLDK